MKLKTLFFMNLSILMVSIFIIIFYFNMKSMQNYIQNQVYSDTQDSAYSLALSIASIEKASDSIVEMQIMINAIFDSGYYEYIKLYKTDNTLLVETRLPLVVKDVPAWFIDFLPLKITPARSDVQLGWSIGKYLLIKGHAGYAYYELWQNFKHFIFVFALITLVSLTVLFFIINILLRSLKSIQKQAEAIDRHQFIVESRVPFIKEFSILTLTMNHMVKKVETIFNSEVDTFQKFQTLKYKDEETLLPNKKYLMLKLQELLDNKDNEVVQAQMAIIYIEGLDTLKDEQGYLAYKSALDALLKSMNNIVQENALLTRISDSEFAILFDVNCDVDAYLDGIQNSFLLTMKDLKVRDAMLCLNTGLTSIDTQDVPTKVLSRADYALQKSKVDGCRMSFNLESANNVDKNSSLGKNAWREKFDKIFENEQVSMALQSVQNTTTKEIFHEETLLRIIEDDGSVNSAALYIPMAYSLGLVQKFDQHIIDIVLNKIKTETKVYAINLSHEYVTQSHLFQELRKKLLQVDKKHKHKLHFESKESDILKELDSYVNFSEMLEGLGQRFGIDRFSGLENIEYIKILRPHYIKISVSIIEEFHKSNSMLLNSFNVLCEVMDIVIIITAVQTETQLGNLQSMGYKHFQGHYISKPSITTDYFLLK